MILPKSELAPPTERTPDLNNISSTSEVKSTKRGTLRKLPTTPVTTKQSKLPLRIETPSSVLLEESAHAKLMEMPTELENVAEYENEEKVIVQPSQFCQTCWY